MSWVFSLLSHTMQRGTGIELMVRSSLIISVGRTPIQLDIQLGRIVATACKLDKLSELQFLSQFITLQLNPSTKTKQFTGIKNKNKQSDLQIKISIPHFPLLSSPQINLIPSSSPATLSPSINPPRKKSPCCFTSHTLRTCFLAAAALADETLVP